MLLVVQPIPLLFILEQLFKRESPMCNSAADFPATGGATSSDSGLAQAFCVYNGRCASCTPLPWTLHCQVTEQGDSQSQDQLSFTQY